MKLFWRGEWMETPGYVVPDVGVLIKVTASVPLFRLDNASGRQTRSPRRKVAVFLFTDGPRRTARKARTKREEPRYTGDFHTCVVLGRAISSGRQVAALASRAPACSQQLVVHRDLVVEVAADFSTEHLVQTATALTPHMPLLTRVCRQAFLYSAMDPPKELVTVFTDALRGRRGSSSSAGSGTRALRPPDADDAPADTALPLNPASAAPGMPVAVLGPAITPGRR